MCLCESLCECLRVFNGMWMCALGLGATLRMCVCVYEILLICVGICRVLSVGTQVRVC